MGSYRLGREADLDRRFEQDGASREAGGPDRSSSSPDRKRASLASSRSRRRGGAGLPARKGIDESSDDSRKDHRSGGGEAMAEALAESQGFRSDGLRLISTFPRSGGDLRTYRTDRQRTLLDGDGLRSRSSDRGAFSPDRGEAIVRSGRKGIQKVIQRGWLEGSRNVPCRLRRQSSENEKSPGNPGLWRRLSSSVSGGLSPYNGH